MSAILRVLVERDIKSRYRNSVLGFLWVLVQPLLLMAIYTLVFGVYARLRPERGIPYAAFLFCGLLPWIWFSASVSAGARSLLEGASLLKKSPFPPEVLPMAACASHGFHFLFSLPVLIGFLLWFGIRPGAAWLCLPGLILLQAAISAGCALLVSLAGVRFRDVGQLLDLALTLGFFLTPVAYPHRYVPEDLRWILQANPMAALAVSYQDVLLYDRVPSGAALASLCGWAALLLGAGMAQFRRAGRRFVEAL